MFILVVAGTVRFSPVYVVLVFFGCCYSSDGTQGVVKGEFRLIGLPRIPTAPRVFDSGAYMRRAAFELKHQGWRTSWQSFWQPFFGFYILFPLITLSLRFSTSSFFPVFLGFCF